MIGDVGGLSPAIPLPKRHVSNPTLQQFEGTANAASDTFGTGSNSRSIGKSSSLQSLLDGIGANRSRNGTQNLDPATMATILQMLSAANGTNGASPSGNDVDLNSLSTIDPTGGLLGSTGNGTTNLGAAAS